MTDSPLKIARDEIATRLDAEKTAIEQAMREVAREVVLRHQQAGQPLVVWQDGKVALVPADAIVSDEATTLS
jgi:hypothetical protein